MAIQGLVSGRTRAHSERRRVRQRGRNRETGATNVRCWKVCARGLAQDCEAREVCLNDGIVYSAMRIPTPRGFHKNAAGVDGVVGFRSRCSTAVEAETPGWSARVASEAQALEREGGNISSFSLRSAR